MLLREVTHAQKLEKRRKARSCEKAQGLSLGEPEHGEENRQTGEGR